MCAFLLVLGVFIGFDGIQDMNVQTVSDAPGSNNDMLFAHITLNLIMIRAAWLH